MLAAIKFWLVVSALLGASGVILGALGSHALPVIDPGRFRLANNYHLIHALALLAVTALAAARSFSVSLHLAAVCFTAGTLLFCGSLYALALGFPPGLARAAPVGGGLLILGWLALAIGAFGSGR